MNSDQRRAVTRDWLAAAVAAALPSGHGLVSLSRFDPDPRGTSGFVKVYFGARCGACKTAAVLSVETRASKTQDEVEAALPSLIQNLLGQRSRFLTMPCSTHRRLRTPRFVEPTRPGNEPVDS